MKKFLGPCLLLPALLLALGPQKPGGELRLALQAEPRTLDPHLAADEPSDLIRYLTSGVLIRLNRRTQRLEPELATSWKLSDGGRKLAIRLREGVKFSDGSPFTSQDVVHTFQRLIDPARNSPVGDGFRPGSGHLACQAQGDYAVSIEFPEPLVSVEKLLDGVAILSSGSSQPESAVLGPFYLAERKPGVYLRLQRNPNFWKRDDRGTRLPYLDSIRLEIQRNRDFELLRFRRGEFHLINNLDAQAFERLKDESAGGLLDLGVSTDSEQMWFNMTPAAPIPAYKKAWFRSRNFRRAISEAINRNDIVRIVYKGHAAPAAGAVPSSNRFWFNANLKPPAHKPSAALARLAQDGFRLQDGLLKDSAGHDVEFSILTNAGNKSREKMAAMIQQDLKAIGIRVNVAALDFPSLLEKISRSFNYEACLLGLVNVDLDPNLQMNLWLSSSSNHQWNPNQKSPETPWEAEVDRLMRQQASDPDPAQRKEAFDRVQEIVAEEVPFIYLVNRNALAGVSPALENVQPSALWPQTLWNAERMSFSSPLRAGSR
ncbi:MAG: ABC transporter substrate-binding protein [Bryobacteraceae bacterium]